jgi:hypothetical protein
MSKGSMTMNANMAQQHSDSVPGALSELIARLEKASGPDMRLDAVIESHVGFRPFGTPQYTASIDAALTLVPDTWAIHEMGELSRLPTGAGWYVTAMKRDGFGEVHAAHPNFAIALCIAALKARAACTTVNHPENGSPAPRS